MVKIFQELFSQDMLCVVSLVNNLTNNHKEECEAGRMQSSRENEVIQIITAHQPPVQEPGGPDNVQVYSINVHLHNYNYIYRSAVMFEFADAEAQQLICLLIAHIMCRFSCFIIIPQFIFPFCFSSGCSLCLQMLLHFYTKGEYIYLQFCEALKFFLCLQSCLRPSWCSLM